MATVDERVVRLEDQYTQLRADISELRGDIRERRDEGHPLGNACHGRSLGIARNCPASLWIGR